MLITGGLVAGESGGRIEDIRIEGETVSEIGPSLVARAGEMVIDACGMVVIPGGVDVHTHMDLDLGSVRSTDDFFSGTVAAACGGTTTIVDHMAFGPRGCSIRHQVDVYHRLAEDKAVIDYGFHGVMDHVDGAIEDELEELSREGITSHKFYLTYDKMISDYEVIRLMERARSLGVLLAVHAENDGAIRFLRDKFIRAGKTAPIYHARSRPPECEAEAVGRVAMLAAMVGDAPVYLVHLSTGLSLDILHAARLRGQKHLFAETCPQYFILDESMYLRDDGLKYIMSPPLRADTDCEALFHGVCGGDIDVIGTDHCPFFYIREKQLGKNDFSKAPGGIPGVETRIPLLFSLVSAGRLDLGRFVSLCCAQPARLFGLYPKKGVLAVGSDADIVIVDPSIRKTLTRDMLHENTDYSPYEGMDVAGYPVKTISRGEVIVNDGRFTGDMGRGRYIKRGLPDFS